MNRSVKIATLSFCIIPLLAGCEKLDINKNCLNSLSSCFKPDKTAPSISSSQALPEAGPTVSLLTAIRVNFSEELSGMTKVSNYKLNGDGAAELSIVSVDKINSSSVQVNLNGSVANNLISLEFPGLTDFGGNALVAGSAVTLQGNVNIPIVFEDASTTYYVSSAVSGPTRVLSAVIHWHHNYEKNANNTYQVKIGGSGCDDAPITLAAGASTPSGAIAANTQVTTTITAASQFSTPGTYTVRICVANTEMNKIGDSSVGVISIQAPPVVTADIGSGSYGGAKTVSFSCGNYCDRIAYNLASGNPAANPTDPAFGAGGSTSNLLMAAPWQTPHAGDPWSTNIELIAYDKAGNQSTLLSLSYTIDINIPNISFGSPAVTNPYVSPTGYSPTVINWNSDKAGSYLICRGGTGCTATPTCVGGTAIGTSTTYPPASQPLGTNIATSIGAASLIDGTNTIHICFSTGVQVGDATRTIVRDSTVPTLSSVAPLDAATSVLPTTTIQVNFTENIAIDASTITPSGTAACSGGIQLSQDFSTNICIPLGAQENISATSFRVKPLSRLAPGIYKIRIANTVKDLAGNSFGGTTQTTGFTVIGLLRQYTFANDANDLVDQAGSNFSLTATGSPQKVTGVDGDANGAYRFNSTGSQYLSAADTFLPTGAASRTICAWINIAQACSTYCMAMMYGAASNGPYLGNNFTGLAHGYYSGPDLSGTTPQRMNTWTHVCSTFSGSTHNFYVNGILDGTATVTPTTALTGVLRIGNESVGTGYPFSGRVDDVRIYTGALSAADIRQMAQVPNGLVAYYPFSDAASGTAIDYTGNGHTGIRNGSPLPASTGDRLGMTGAYTFGGPSQYISASDTGLPSGNAPRTLCTWIRPTTLPGSGQFRIAARYGVPGTSQESYIGLHNNAGQQSVIFSSGNDHLIAAYPVATATWMHLCGSYDGTMAKIYANGQLLASAAKIWNTVLLGNNGILIGQRDLTGSQIFSGSIDEVRIYNRVLTDNEVFALSSQLGIGLLRQYTFRNGSLTDDAGSGFNLTAVGSPALTTGFDGISNGAFNLTGSEQFTVTDNGLPASNSPRSMCLWIYAADTSGNSFPLSYGVPQTTSQGSFLYAASLNEIGLGSYATVLLSSYNLPVASWHHICGILDANGNATIYVDGAIAPNGGPTPITFSTVLSGNLAIGARSDNAFRWHGRLDSIRLYNRALGLAEIADLGSY